METYYKPNNLPKFGDIGKDNPNLARKFFDYYEAVFAEGELTQREKSLIALAVAHAVQCPYCIDAYHPQTVQGQRPACEPIILRHPVSSKQPVPSRQTAHQTIPLLAS